MNDKRSYFVLFIYGYVFMLFLSLNIFAQDNLRTEDLFNMSLEELMDIEIITAGKQSEKIGDIPASVVIITRDEIAVYGYTTVEDILQHVPGFYMIDDYSWLNSINFGVRGFFSTGIFNDVHVMVNGINQVADNWNGYPNSKINVPVESIDRIEIVRGPMSVIYGSNAFMGAINIITNQADKEHAEYYLQASYGSLNTQKLFLRAGRQGEDLKIVINASHHKTDGIDVPYSDFTSNAAFLTQVGVSPESRTKELLRESAMHFNLSAQLHNLTMNLAHMEMHKGMFDAFPSLGDGAINSTQATNAALAYTYQISPEIKFKGSALWALYNYNIKYDVFFEGLYAFDRMSSTAYEFEVNGYYKPADDFDWTIGLYRRGMNYYSRNLDVVFPQPLPFVNSEVKLPRDRDMITDAIFTQLNYRILSTFKITAGLRFEKQRSYNFNVWQGIGTDYEKRVTAVYKNDDINVIPRLAAIFTPHPDHTIKILYGQAIKQPSFEENTDIVEYDIPPLRSAKIRTVELNYLWSFSPRIYANLSIFHNNLNDLIIRSNEVDLEDSTVTIIPKNSGEMKTTGFEAGLHIRPSKTWQAEISLTYQNSQNKQTGMENISMGYSPQWLGYAKAACFISPTASIGLTGRFIGAMETEWNMDPVDPGNGDYSPKGRVGNRIAPYHVINGNFRVSHIFDTGLYLNLHIHNILDTEIRYPATRSNSWIEKGTLGRGRTFLLSAGWVF